MKRKDFLKTLGILPFTISNMNLNELKNISDNFPKSEKMPVVFIGHGSPMNALADNAFTDSLALLGKNIERPKAILVISAHWLTMNKTYVSVNPFPKTIYDFGGFPEELYKVKYEPKGSPEFAKEVISEVKSIGILEEHQMGLDHGAWTVLRHIYPAADIPTFQMSIDYSKPAQYHFELAKELQNLRNKGVLILSSGNIVHNLRQVKWGETNPKPYDWAVEFDTIVESKLNQGKFADLADFKTFGNIGSMAHPSIDHYLPMVYSVGLINPKEEIKYTYKGLEMGSLSMRCFQAG
ncbi:4,5-DOPA dioxygenase extradiol [Emticicia sp. SJ17W-69]|uniref:4,5-DOPA-extradiol-dioxygenase n=1 Tax=Emticicia sp. SJ17W-69 TaxID=3421657 RepID=UPI003EBAF29E